MCRPHRRFAPLLSRPLHRIPQAVSTVATEEFLHNIVNMLYVSIPQAVSTVATAGSKKPVFKRFQKVVLENLKP